MHHYLQLIPPHHVTIKITEDVINSDTISKSKSKITQPMGIHLQSMHKYRNVFGDSNIQYHDFNNDDALIFKDKYTTLL